MEGLGELGINLPSFIAQLINFLLLFGLLYLVAYKPILRMFDERSRRIRESMDQTEQIKVRAQEAEEEYAKRVEAASKRSQEIVERANKTAEEIRERASSEARVEAETILNRAKAEIRGERDQVIEQLHKEFADITILAAGKVIEKSLDKKAHQTLINNVLAESNTLRKN
jgi:F-type H+-transporting ATPase subunit b